MALFFSYIFVKKKKVERREKIGIKEKRKEGVTGVVKRRRGEKKREKGKKEREGRKRERGAQEEENGECSLVFSLFFSCSLGLRAFSGSAPPPPPIDVEGLFFLISPRTKSSLMSTAELHQQVTTALMDSLSDVSRDPAGETVSRERERKSWEGRGD